MSVTYTKSWGWTDTVPFSTDPLAINLYDLSYKADFAPVAPTQSELDETKRTRGSHDWYGNVTSPTDQPERIRVTRSKIANMYANRDEINPAYWAPSKEGGKIFYRTTDIMRVWNDTTGTWVDLPVAATTSLSWIYSPFLTDDDVFAFIKRHQSWLYNGADTKARLVELMKGANTLPDRPS